MLAAQAFPDGLNVSPPALLLAAGFAVVIALAAGLYPALRASRLTPVDAIRAAQDSGGAPAPSRGGPDRLAAEGVRFETARAHNVVTLPSHANLLSGQYPLRHRVRDNTGFRFPADRATLATILREYQGEVAAADDALGPLLEPFLAASTAERASGSSRPTTASRSEGTARRRTASSLTRRPCACPSSFGRRGSCPRESSAPPSGTSPG